MCGIHGLAKKFTDLKFNCFMWQSARVWHSTWYMLYLWWLPLRTSKFKCTDFSADLPIPWGLNKHWFSVKEKRKMTFVIQDPSGIIHQYRWLVSTNDLFYYATCMLRNACPISLKHRKKEKNPLDEITDNVKENVNKSNLLNSNNFFF